MTGIVARATALALVGPSLCTNADWLRLSVGTTAAVFGAANEIRDNYSPWWRWLARWRSAAPKKMLGMRKEAAELLRPLYEERLGAVIKGKAGGYVDSLAWLLRLQGANRSSSLEDVADQQLFLSIASIHTTSATSTSILFDLMSRPEDQDDVRGDIRRAVKEKGDAAWTLQDVASMRRLDSFMKESQRMHPLGFSKCFFLPVFPFLSLCYCFVFPSIAADATRKPTTLPHFLFPPFYLAFPFYTYPPSK